MLRCAFGLILRRAICPSNPDNWLRLVVLSHRTERSPRGVEEQGQPDQPRDRHLLRRPSAAGCRSYSRRSCQLRLRGTLAQAGSLVVAGYLGGFLRSGPRSKRLVGRSQPPVDFLLDLLNPVAFRALRSLRTINPDILGETTARSVSELSRRFWGTQSVALKHRTSVPKSQSNLSDG